MNSDLRLFARALRAHPGLKTGGMFTGYYLFALLSVLLFAPNGREVWQSVAAAAAIGIVCPWGLIVSTAWTDRARYKKEASE